MIKFILYKFTNYFLRNIDLFYSNIELFIDYTFNVLILKTIKFLIFCLIYAVLMLPVGYILNVNWQISFIIILYYAIYINFILNTKY